MTNQECARAVVDDREMFTELLAYLLMSAISDEGYFAWSKYKDQVKLWIKREWLDKETKLVIR